MKQKTLKKMHLAVNCYSMLNELLTHGYDVALWFRALSYALIVEDKTQILKLYNRVNEIYIKYL